MPEETVFISRGKDPYKAAKKALDYFDFSVKNKKVLIKPNLTVCQPPQKGITTDPLIVKAVLERLKNCNITIADASYDTKLSFERFGWRELAKKFNAKLLDLNDDKIVWKDIPKPLHSDKLPFASTVFGQDYLVNVAKLKAHSVATVTLCMKNLFGCVPTSKLRQQYHPFIRKAMLDINQAIHSNFCIIDGIIGNELDECEPHPIKSGIVIAGKNPMAVDMVGCLCMGVNPMEIDTFQLAEQLFGKPKIVVKGAKIEAIAKSYKMPQLTV